MVQQITISRCAGRGERPYLQFTFGVPLRTHPGIVFKLTANPTDTGSILPCTVANGSGISPSHNPIPKRFDQQGTNIFLFYYRTILNSRNILGQIDAWCLMLVPKKYCQENK